MLLYIMLAYLMLFAALSNMHVCIMLFIFFAIFLQMLFVFMLCLCLLNIVCLFEVLFCIMHSAFNLLIFPNSMFTPFKKMKGLCALWRNST